MPSFTTVATESAQIAFTAADLGEKVGHEQDLPHLEPRADAAAASLTGGLTAGGPPGVLTARFGS